MIGKTRKPHKLWASGVLVVASVTAVLAGPFSAVANAAPATNPVTAITADHSSYNADAGTAVAITGTYSVTNAANAYDGHIQFTVTQGPDTTSPLFSQAGTNCSEPDEPAGANPRAYSCSVTLAHAGQDTVRVYADDSNDNKWESGEKFVDVTVTVAGPAFSVTLSPTQQTNQVGDCAPYTATVKDQNGNPLVDEQVDVTVAQSGASLTECTPTPGLATPSPLTFSTTTGDTAGGNPGVASFSFKSNTAGTASVTAKDHSNTGAADTATETFVTSTQQAAKSLSVQPKTFNGYTGAHVDYTATVKDANGNPLSNVVVTWQVTSGPDANAASTCGTTGADGTATCTLTNLGAGHPGTDNVTFWVNQSPGTAGPDSGEPQDTATATFAEPPAFNSDVATCNNEDTTQPPTGQAATCHVPTTQTATIVTATVKNNGTPVSGVIVNFTESATNSPDATKITINPTSCTTGSDGTCTTTVTEPSPANTESIVVTPHIGASNGTAATINYETPSPTVVTVSPKIQTVSTGGAVSATATVADQFGTGVSGQSVSFLVTSANQNGVNCTVDRNPGVNKTVTTDSSGNAVFSYTDAGANPSAMCDQISATWNGHTVWSTVEYITGSTTASSVAVATNSADVDPTTNPGTCNTTASGANSQTNVAIGSGAAVCAHVTNSSGTPLAGKSVTFTVDQGFVGPYDTTKNNNDNATATITAGKTSFTTTTDANGNAFADAASNTSGTQTVTAQADSAKGTGTVTYNAAAPGSAYAISLTPPNPTITPGGTQKFTATVVDQFGNPVAGVTVSFSATGPGSFGAVSSTSGTTASDGTVTATLTASNTTGNGTVTATITAPNAAVATCGSNPNAKTNPSNCSAQSTYTVANTPPPPSGMSLPAYRSGSSNFFKNTLAGGAPDNSISFGNSGDVPLWGDWDGNGTPSIGVYRPSNRTFYLSNDNKTAAIVVTIGNSGDKPAAGDFNGDGTDSIALFRPSTGTWYITNNDHTVSSSFVYGSNGDIPLVGDWTHQGVSKVGVYRPSTGTFYRIGHAGIRYGNVGDKPIVGDWDGDGTTTIGVVRGTVWYPSNNNSSAATSFSFGVSGAQFFTWSQTVSSSAPTSS